MQTFLRPKGDIEKLLKKLDKPRTGDLLATYRQTIKIREDYSRAELANFDAETVKYIESQKLLLQHLSQFSKSLKQNMSNKEEENKLTRKFVAFLSVYEDQQAINAKGFGDVAQIKLFGDTNTGLKEKLDAMV